MEELTSYIATYISNLAQKWSDPGPKMKLRSLLGIVILSGLIVAIFHDSQSILLPAVNLPIILTAIVFKTRGGIAAGIIAGILLTPPVVAPVEVGLQTFNNFFQWILGSTFFIIVGIISGSTFGIMNYQFTQLKQSSLFTPDSKLPNKYKLLEDIEAEIISEELDSLTLLLISIDNISGIINNLGHERSGRFFRTVARQLQEKTDYQGEIYSVYEDNIALLLHNSSAQNISSFIEKLLASLNEPFYFDEIPIYLDTFVGSASFPADAEDCNELFQHTYLAVNQARSRQQEIAFYDPAWDQTGRDNLLLLGGIKKAIKEEEFVLHYQPKIDLADQKIAGAEVLIRWQHPEMGFISPGRFIPQIEKTALIDDLTYFVLGKAAESLLLLEDEGLDINMAVNITPRNLRSENFLTDVEEIFSRHAINPEKIELELTETDVMQQMQKSTNIINELDNMGFNFALDDFGTGYSSLAYLKNLPFDCIKIDRSLVQGMTTDPQNKEIVNTAVRLGHILDKKTIAEGVEKRETLEELKNLNCNFAQGFYIARPLPFEELKEFCHDQY